MNIEKKPISEICEINPKLKNASIGNDSSVSFIPMASIDEVTGSIKTTQERPFVEVKKGFTPFAENDVLFAKITPCMENGKVALARNLKHGIGFGSTEFHVFRANKKVLPAWIYYFLRQKKLRIAAEKYMTGSAGQKRVPTNFFKKVFIPVPPMDVQKRIVKSLAQIDQSLAKRRQAIALLDEFLKAVFVEMLGEPVGNVKGWPTKKLRELCEIVRGSSPRPATDPRYYGGTVPRLMVADVTRDGMYVKPQIDFLTDAGAKLSRPMKKGDVVIAVSGDPGLPCILDVNACIHDGFVGLRTLDIYAISNIYLYHYLKNLKARNKSKAVGAIFKNLNTDQIKNIEILVPPLTHQMNFLKKADRVDVLRAKCLASESELQNLFGAVMQNVFGESI